MKPKDNDADALRRALLALLPALGLGEIAQAQDAAKSQPDSYRVAFENDQMRVLEFWSRPGMGMCGVGQHSHPAHLTIALTAAKVRVVDCPFYRHYGGTNEDTTQIRHVLREFEIEYVDI